MYALESGFRLETTPTQSPQQHTSQSQMHVNRIAWVVLVSSFVTFILICGVITFGVYNFVFLSSVPMETTLRVSRGSVGLVRTDLSESFELEQRFLSRGDTVLTDSQSQANVSIRDPKSNQILVTSVTVKNDSNVIVRQVNRPRFDWSSRPYQVIIEGVQGEVDIFVPGNLARLAHVSVELPQDVLVEIRGTGLYTLTFNESLVQLDVHTGQAVLSPVHANGERMARGGQSVVYDLITGTIEVKQGYENLLKNNLFIQPPAPAFNDAVQAVSLPAMDTWNCGDRTTYDKRGQAFSAFFDGRLTVNLQRGGNAVTHGETACIQPFGPSAQVGQRVDMYDLLEIRTTFYIDGHSLDVCGIEGSECPLMLLMDYVDTDGESNQWFHGFYVNFNPANQYPVSCVSCQQEHKRINDKVWYTYESGNLFNLLPPDRRPASILNIRFYASGHDYNVYVNELSILAAPPTVPQDQSAIENS